MSQRHTARGFAPGAIDADTYRMIMEAARLSPSGANTQPWHFIAVTSSWTRRVIAEYVAASAARRAGRVQAQEAEIQAMAQAPGWLVVATDFRLSWAYPGIMDGTELDQRYHANAERVILQSVACATGAAQLAAAALGYHSWWVSVLGQDDVQAAMHPLLGVPDDLTITDILLFGPPASPARPRWKKTVAEVLSFDRFDMGNFRSLEQIDAWMKDLSATFLKKSSKKLLSIWRV